MKSRMWIALALLVVVVIGGVVSAKDRTGTLELINVPETAQGGRYDAKNGVFTADLTEIEDAFVKITFDDMTITGKRVEWRTDDDYMKLVGSVLLEKEDFDLSSDELEYFGDEERLFAKGNVFAETEDATVKSEEMVYYESADEAHFLGNVLVTVEDGSFKGQKFVMFLEQDRMEFYGPFSGEFVRKSSEQKQVEE